MVGACVAPARAAELEVPSSPYPGQICPSSRAQTTPLSCLHGLLCAAPALQSKACTIWEEWAGAGSPVHSPTLVALRKCNPSFLPQKLFASVLLDSHFSTNSINSQDRPLAHTICFPAWLTPRISFLTDIMNNATSWLWTGLDLTQDYYKVY